jgi:hypothetical protein
MKMQNFTRKNYEQAYRDIRTVTHKGSKDEPYQLDSARSSVVYRMFGGDRIGNKAITSYNERQRKDKTLTGLVKYKLERYAQQKKWAAERAETERIIANIEAAYQKFVVPTLDGKSKS